MNSPETFFTELADRALARAKAAPALELVTPLIDRGWLLEFRLADGREQVEVNATFGEDAGELEYSYRPPSHASPQREQHLRRVGRLLCEALARASQASVEAAPPVPTVASAPGPRESLNFYLVGECDRGCIFCSVSMETEQGPHGPDLLDRLRRLPIFTAPKLGPEHGPEHASDSNENDLPAEVEAGLRERAEEAEQVRVGWSGKDCIASPHFDRLLRYAHGLGYRDMNIQTPGTRLLEPGFLDFLREHSVTEVALTAHAASEEVFDRVGGKPGAYRIFWDAVERLLEHDFRLSFEIPCIAETVEDLPEHLARLATYPSAMTCFYWYPSPDMNHLFSQIGIPFAPALAALERARELLEPKRVCVDGIPACVATPELRAHYSWGGGIHMSFLDCERLEICAECDLREECPGVAPVYSEHYPFPNTARPIRRPSARAS